VLCNSEGNSARGRSGLEPIKPPEEDDEAAQRLALWGLSLDPRNESSQDPRSFCCLICLLYYALLLQFMYRTSTRTQLPVRLATKDTYAERATTTTFKLKAPLQGFDESVSGSTGIVPAG